GNGGAVAAHVLGERVYHDVGTVLDRAPQVGRRHGIVDDQRNARVVGDLGQLLDVGDIARGIADGLAEQRLGPAVDETGQTLEVVVVGETHLDAPSRQAVGKEVIGTAVELAGGDDVVTDFGDGLDGVLDRCHA